MAYVLESNKKELQLSINNVNKPTELSGKEAWIQLITNLLFLKPGSFPSQPDMGIDISRYEYEFIDEAMSDIESRIYQQVTTYLPEVPFQQVDVSKVMMGGIPVVVIAITLEIPKVGYDTSVLAITKRPGNIIDFEIVM